jgi:hypothetical protein
MTTQDLMHWMHAHGWRPIPSLRNDEWERGEAIVRLPLCGDDDDMLIVMTRLACIHGEREADIATAARRMGRASHGRPTRRRQRTGCSLRLCCASCGVSHEARRP